MSKPECDYPYLGSRSLDNLVGILDILVSNEQYLSGTPIALLLGTRSHLIGRDFGGHCTQDSRGKGRYRIPQ